MTCNYPSNWEKTCAALDELNINLQSEIREAVTEKVSQVHVENGGVGCFMGMRLQRENFDAQRELRKIKHAIIDAFSEHINNNNKRHLPDLC